MYTLEEIQVRTMPLLQKNDVSFAGVFGSYAQGTQTSDSDVDIVVRFGETKSLFELIRIEQQLSEVLGKKVDLVTEDFLSPHFRDDACKKMTVIYGQR